METLTLGPVHPAQCGCCFRHHGGVVTLKEDGPAAWVCRHCQRMDRLDLYPHSAPKEETS